MPTRDDPYLDLERALTRARPDPAAEFSEWLGGQLDAKGNRRMVFRDPDAPEPVEENAPKTDADTSKAPTREDRVRDALERHRLPADDADLLSGVPDDDLDEVAQKLSDRFTGARRPLPNPAQGQNQGTPAADPAAEFGEWLSGRLRNSH